MKHIKVVAKACLKNSMEKGGCGGRGVIVYVGFGDAFCGMRERFGGGR